MTFISKLKTRNIFVKNIMELITIGTHAQTFGIHVYVKYNTRIVYVYMSYIFQTYLQCASSEHGGKHIVLLFSKA